ncbi:hypothetical protein Cgig2_017652 [Carnegiea gigantea]|uniref:Uncharacterized protein n=1 Tax=Carnegiea gigantea TaxID=171969 RepID=A0A9Q1KBG7_9CARY|nr:hypothetical protein Cgig2_017652 [Carnegiea gigantea]
MTIPTMVLGGREAAHFASPHNDPLVVEMKVASAISSVDIITWDCLQKVTYPGRDIVPLVYPILGFEGQEARNLEVDFLVVEVPTAYNVILGRPTLHKFKYSKPKKKKNTNATTKGGLHIGPATILTVLIFGSLGLSIQGIGRLAFQAIPLAGRWDKLHLFWVPTLGLSLLMLVDVIEVGLKVVILLKVWSQCTPWRPYDLADRPAPWPWLPSQPLPLPQPQPQLCKAPPLAGAANRSSPPPWHPSLPSASPRAIGTGPRGPPSFSAQSWPLLLERKPWPYSPRLR